MRIQITRSLNHGKTWMSPRAPLGRTWRWVEWVTAISDLRTFEWCLPWNCKRSPQYFWGLRSGVNEFFFRLFVYRAADQVKSPLNTQTTGATNTVLPAIRTGMTQSMWISPRLLHILTNLTELFRILALKTLLRPNWRQFRTALHWYLVPRKLQIKLINHRKRRGNRGSRRPEVNLIYCKWLCAQTSLIILLIWSRRWASKLRIPRLYRCIHTRSD